MNQPFAVLMDVLLEECAWKTPQVLVDSISVDAKNVLVSLDNQK